METEYDKELISALNQDILSGKMKVYEQTDQTIEEIESNFIMGFNGIDWEKNEIIYFEKFDSNQFNYVTDAGKFLQKIKNTHSSLLEETVKIIGDSLINMSYEMKFRDLLAVYDKFLSIPQHTFIWFEKSKKCINFTFENEMYFG